MMRKFYFLLFVFIIALTFSLAAIGSGSVMILKGGRLGDVNFPHKGHQKKIKDCSACHNLISKEKGSIQKQISSGKIKKKAVMNQCTRCHKSSLKEKKKSGPVKCKTCHKK